MQKLVMDFDIFVLFCFWQKQKETIAKPFIFFTQKKKLRFSQLSTTISKQKLFFRQIF